MKVLITGGGTGGHIYPAIAIAEQLKKVYSKVDILYVGSKVTMEKDIVPKAGIKYKSIDTAPLNKKIGIQTVANICLLIKGFFQARKIIKTFKPNVIVGTGGYVSGSVVLAGALKGIPTAIHEQNAIPGMTNRLLSRLVDAIMLSFDEARDHFKQKDKIVFTGLPVLRAFFESDKLKSRKDLEIPEDVFLVLSVGGSNGALKLNELLLKAYSQIGEEKNIDFIHVTGKRYYPHVMEHIRLKEWETSNRVDLHAYVSDMPKYMAAADFIISRAGASTLNEIIASKTPSLIIPSPNVANNHQFYNAQVIDKYGMGVVVEECDVTSDMIEHILLDFYNEPSKLEIMKKNCAQIDLSQSIDAIVQTILKLGKKGKHIS